MAANIHNPRLFVGVDSRDGCDSVTQCDNACAEFAAEGINVSSVNLSTNTMRCDRHGARDQGVRQR